jgi:hypothetical protein
MACVSRLSAWTGLLVAMGLVVTACSGTVSTDTKSPGRSTTYTIPNQGGTNEGHTPTAFAGTGSGLFAGDNLNPSFPDGVGVQLYLTFALPDDADVGSAVLTSEALKIAGSPFNDLGPLTAERVIYQSFGPELFDLAGTGQLSECTLVDDASIECDVTAAVHGAIDVGDTDAQFRIRFLEAADNDGEQDLAMFFSTDSNTNEAGLFELTITPTR